MSAMTHFAGNEVTVDTSTGEAYISQRKLALELGIHHSSLQQYLATRHSNCMISEGIPSKVLQETAIHFAYKSKAANSTAEAFAGKILEAGAKAYLYHEAGIVLSAVTQQPRPLTYIESLELLLASEKEKEALRIDNLKTTVALDHKKDITNEGNDYFTIASVKPLNQGIKLSGSKLTQESYDQELLPKQLFGMYGVNTPNAYHKEVWEAVYPEIILPE